MAPEFRPPFVSFLLPTLHFPCRRNLCSVTSEHTSTPVPLSGPLTKSDPNVPSSARPKPLLRADYSSLSGSLPSPTPRLARRNPSTIRCLKCSTDLAYTTQIISKRFTGRLGQAYLIDPPLPPPFIPSFPPKPRPKSELVNTRTARSIHRKLLTGVHVVADVSCASCSTVIGWKYLDACEDSQRYKIGKFILEQERVCISSSWEDDGSYDGPFRQSHADTVKELQTGWLGSGRCFDSEIQFDSEDEEECEILFSGAWDPDIIARRRAKMKKLSTCRK
ncbi:hypothetical protein K3495_g11683 [Podosphaera aphanis]|nr:hypothetical protein K3495_g11683 [Podosphaera aphanis]